jgi:hypothetical protein
MTTPALDEVPMAGRHTQLRPLTPQFTEQLYELASLNRIPWQWRAPETPQAFHESLWQGVLVQYQVEELRTGRPVAFVRADNANLFFGHAYLTMMLHPEFKMRVWPLEGALLFGHLLFMKFNLQHLYAETPSSLYDQFKSGVGKLFDVEGQLRNRVVLNGRREDLFILTFTRERWLAEGIPALERIVGPMKVRPAS